MIQCWQTKRTYLYRLAIVEYFLCPLYHECVPNHTRSSGNARPSLLHRSKSCRLEGCFEQDNCESGWLLEFQVNEKDNFND